MGEGAQTDRHSLGGFKLCPSPGAAAGGHEQHAGMCETVRFLLMLLKKKNGLTVIEKIQPEKLVILYSPKKTVVIYCIRFCL